MMAGNDRFVLLHHKNPGGNRNDHWDLMLENNGSLVTFEIPEGCFKDSIKNPRQTAQDSGLASPFEVTRLPNHRMAYLTYEGEISNNRGTVSQVDSGKYSAEPPVCDFDNRGSLEGAIIRLNGQIFSGNLRLFFLSHQRDQLVGQWQSDVRNPAD